MREVTGVEINSIIIDVLKRHFSDYTAIATLDGVAFEVDEAVAGLHALRAILRCHPDEFDRYLGGDGCRRLHAY